MNLNWIEIGNIKSEECIIFLHEGLGCIEMWKKYPAEICENLGVRGIIYDRSGYGKSDGSLLNRTVNYLHDAAIELRTFLDYLKIEKVHLYGHSDGGSIALIFSGNFPHKVKTVITEAAHIINEPTTIQGVKKARPLLATGKMEGLKKYHGDRYQEVFYAWNDIWLDPSFEKWNIIKEVSKIKCPLLAIQGKDDQYGTLKQIELICETTSGFSRYYTPSHCGHAPFKEQKEYILNEVIKFYNEFN